jgi:hypothetical protein
MSDADLNAVQNKGKSARKRTSASSVRPSSEVIGHAGLAVPMTAKHKQQVPKDGVGPSTLRLSQIAFEFEILKDPGRRRARRLRLPASPPRHPLARRTSSR